MAIKCIRAFVSGRVQGVFFRDSTRQQASRLKIQGHAINLPDGRVEVLACGGADEVEQLVEWLHEGPKYASVSGVVIEEVTPLDTHGFTIG